MSGWGFSSPTGCVRRRDWRNAVIPIPAQTALEISVRREGDRAVLDVRDHGPGLPADAVDRTSTILVAGSNPASATPNIYPRACDSVARQKATPSGLVTLASGAYRRLEPAALGAQHVAKRSRLDRSLA